MSKVLTALITLAAVTVAANVARANPACGDALVAGGTTTRRACDPTCAP